jgi:hypothetical protein
VTVTVTEHNMISIESLALVQYVWISRVERLDFSELGQHCRVWILVLLTRDRIYFIFYMEFKVLNLLISFNCVSTNMSEN